MCDLCWVINTNEEEADYKGIREVKTKIGEARRTNEESLKCCKNVQ